MRFNTGINSENIIDWKGEQKFLEPIKANFQRQSHSSVAIGNLVYLFGGIFSVGECK